MLSSVLTSKRAIAINIQVIDTFVKLQKMSQTHELLAKKLNELEQKFLAQNKTNHKQFFEIFRAIKQLSKEESKSSKIGFVVD